MTLPTSENLLDQIESISIDIKSNLKKPQLDKTDQLLDLLDNLIQQSADRFMSLGDADHMNIEEDDYSPYIVHPDDLIQAKNYTNVILLRLISNEEDEVRMERASRILAHMSGRGAAGSITRTWHIPYLDTNGDRNELLVPLHEPCYVGNDLGFKTWGAAPMMAKKLLQQNIIPNISECRILEIGTGTGMVGLVCDHLGAKEIHVTDYHPRVLENVAYNIQLNQSKAKVSKLDFIQVAKDESPEWKDVRYDIVIASDLLYEMEHAKYLPQAIDKLMKDKFYFMIPLRDTHWEEVNYFQDSMKLLGFTCVEQQDYEREEEEGIVQFRYYEFVKL